MPVRKPLSLWLSVSMLGLSTAVTPLVYRALCPPFVPPRTLQELSELLCQAEPGLLVVPIMPSRPEGGLWVCERPRSWDELARLRRAPEYAYRWQGVVLCERIGEMTELVDTEIWGEHGMQVGPLLLFGDPALLRRIHQAILNHQEVK